MNKLLIALGIVVFILILVFIPFGMYFGYSNSFKLANNEVEAQLKQVDNILLRRHDLIPNLVNTVKGYATHEKDVFTNLNNARNQLMQANNMKEKAAANKIIAMNKNGWASKTCQCKERRVAGNPVSSITRMYSGMLQKAIVSGSAKDSSIFSDVNSVGRAWVSMRDATPSRSFTSGWRRSQNPWRR